MTFIEILILSTIFALTFFTTWIVLQKFGKTSYTKNPFIHSIVFAFGIAAATAYLLALELISPSILLATIPSILLAYTIARIVNPRLKSMCGDRFSNNKEFAHMQLLRFDNNYLIPKLLEIIVQQLLIYSMISVVMQLDGLSTVLKMLLFVLVFGILHLVLLAYGSKFVNKYLILPSFLLSAVFPLLALITPYYLAVTIPLHYLFYFFVVTKCALDYNSKI